MASYQHKMTSPIGDLYLLSNGTAICGVSLVDSSKEEGILEKRDTVLQQAQEELEEYFSGRRRYFTCPLALEGTSFQRKTWGLLQEISYGEVRTYGDLALRFSHPRAIGQALGKNPLPIFIPCHRVVGKKGLTGFGMGLETKKYLLELEEKYRERGKR